MMYVMKRKRWNDLSYTSNCKVEVAICLSMLIFVNIEATSKSFPFPFLSSSSSSHDNDDHDKMEKWIFKLEKDEEKKNNKNTSDDESWFVIVKIGIIIIHGKEIVTQLYFMNELVTELFPRLPKYSNWIFSVLQELFFFVNYYFLSSI